MRVLWRAFCMAALFALLPVLPASAEVLTLSGQGEYIMEDNETMKAAQETAYSEAVRQIAQATAAAVASRSAAKDAMLTADEIELMANAVMKVTEKNFSKEVTPDGKLRIRAHVRAEVDEAATDQWLRERLAAREAERQYAETKVRHDERQGQRAELERRYGEARRDAAAALVEEGNALYAEGKKDEALQRYNEAIEANPNLADAYAQRGFTYPGWGKSELAKRDFEKALSLDGKNAGAHYGIAGWFEENGLIAQAIAEYRAVIDCGNIVEHGVFIADALERIVALGG